MTYFHDLYNENNFDSYSDVRCYISFIRGLFFLVQYRNQVQIFSSSAGRSDFNFLKNYFLIEHDTHLIQYRFYIFLYLITQFPAQTYVYNLIKQVSFFSSVPNQNHFKIILILKYNKSK